MHLVNDSSFKTNKTFEDNLSSRLVKRNYTHTGFCKAELGKGSGCVGCSRHGPDAINATASSKQAVQPPGMPIQQR